MRTSIGKIRNAMCLMVALMISVALAACGGSGGGSTSSTSPGVAGPATVGISVGSAPDFPVGTTFAAASASPAKASGPPDSTPPFEHVWVKVNRIALIPVDSIPYMERNKPNPDGELEVEDTAESNGGFVEVALDPSKTIDLLNPPSGAKILNRFPSIPAGEYGKIRIYYDNVVGEPASGDNVLFHQTANYHFDVHFVGGNLVVPAASDPDGGIRFFQVNIGVVGLKIVAAGNSGKFLMRPQVFATVDTPKYLVSGVAQNVNPANNTFDILTPGGVTVPAAYSASTAWIYVDNTVLPVSYNSLAGDALGASGLRDGAIVDVIGTFSPGNVLLAEEVDITFPDMLTGKVSIGWDNSTNTFDLRLATDNVVFPMPTRWTAYYDNAVDLSQLYESNISDNAAIIARGYKVTGGINAYWISIGP